MRAYTQDLRKRVLLAVDMGHPRAEIVQFLGVSLATIKRYDPRNDKRKGMCAPKRSLVGPRRNGQR